jgi:hypothetical protein
LAAIEISLERAFLGVVCSPDTDCLESFDRINGISDIALGISILVGVVGRVPVDSGKGGRPILVRRVFVFGTAGLEVWTTGLEGLVFILAGFGVLVVVDLPFEHLSFSFSECLEVIVWFEGVLEAKVRLDCSLCILVEESAACWEEVSSIHHG